MCAASLIRTVTVGIGFAPIRQRLFRCSQTYPLGLLPVGTFTLPRSKCILSLFYSRRKCYFAAFLTFSIVRLSFLKSTEPSGLVELDSTVSQPE